MTGAYKLRSLRKRMPWSSRRIFVTGKHGLLEDGNPLRLRHHSKGEGGGYASQAKFDGAPVQHFVSYRHLATPLLAVAFIFMNRAPSLWG